MIYSDEYWAKRLPEKTPEKVKRAIKAVYSAYPKKCLPQGTSDPMYIINLIALVIGFGNGKGNFNLPKKEI